MHAVRVLITSTPGLGHVGALLPTAAMLRRAGHQVVWAVATDAIGAVRASGFDAVPAGLTVGERVAELSDRLPSIMQLPVDSRRAALFAGFFAIAAAPVMARQLGPIVDKFRPDVIVHEVAEFAAAPVAVAKGIPHMSVAFSGVLPRPVLLQSLHCLAPVWAEFGLPEPSAERVAGSLYVHPFARSLGRAPEWDAALCRVVASRPGTEGFVGAEPSWLHNFGATRPGIYITAGTTDVATRQAPWSVLFEAVGGLDADVLATIGPHAEMSMIGPVPRNVHIERFIPQHYVLRRAHLVISHGGAGPALGAAQRGLPQLMIPTFADGFDNAQAFATSGAALACEANERMPLNIRTKVIDLLNTPAYGAAARRLAEEFAAMPSIEDHLRAIEALAT